MAKAELCQCTDATKKGEWEEIELLFEITYILYCKSPFVEKWEKNWSYYAVKDAIDEARYQYNLGNDVLILKIPTLEIKYKREHPDVWSKD